MSTDVETTAAPGANELAGQRTDLALERTIMAAERTLLAWIRTAIAMIGFGFTVYKFIELLNQQGTVQPLWKARNLGLSFIAIGTIGLTLAVLQHGRLMQRLRREGRHAPLGPSMLVAAFVSVVGILALLNVLFQIGPF
jgi:putative membrane protein